MNKTRKSKGGNLLNGLSQASTTAILPFGLLYAQKKLQKSTRTNNVYHLYKRHSNKHRFKKSFKTRKYR